MAGEQAGLLACLPQSAVWTYYLSCVDVEVIHREPIGVASSAELDEFEYRIALIGKLANGESLAMRIAKKTPDTCK